MKSIRSAKYIYVIAALFFFTTSFLYKTINVSLSDSKKSVNNFSQVLVKKEKELLSYVNELADEATVLPLINDALPDPIVAICIRNFVLL